MVTERRKERMKSDSALGWALAAGSVDRQKRKAVSLARFVAEDPQREEARLIPKAQRSAAKRLVLWRATDGRNPGVQAMRHKWVLRRVTGKRPWPKAFDASRGFPVAGPTLKGF